MSDDLRAGLGQPGQRTSEVTSGRSANIAEPLEHLRLLLFRRALEVIYVAVYAPVLVGPWIMAIYTPVVAAWLKPRLWLWLWPMEQPRRIPPVALIVTGLLMAVAVALAPAETWTWWPCRWLWARMEPRWIWGRAVALLLPLVPWRTEEHYVTSRQRQEIAVPTLSGVAYAQPQPHLVQLPGWRNPFRDPSAPQTQLAPAVTRAMFWRPEKAGKSNAARIVDCPASIANALQLDEMARLVLERGVMPTRAQMTRHGIFSDPGWRAFQDWAVSEGLLEKTGAAANAPYALTDDGRAWLTTLLEGQPA